MVLHLLRYSNLQEWEILRADIQTKDLKKIFHNAGFHQLDVHEGDSLWETLHCLEKTAKTAGTTKNIWARLRKAYRGIIWQEFSVDLVAVCPHQYAYTSRLINECHGIGGLVGNHQSLLQILASYEERSIETYPHRPDIGYRPVLTYAPGDVRVVVAVSR